MREKQSAGGKQAHAARRALEERRAKLFFEILDLPAERWLGDAEATRGAADVPLLRHGDEIAKLREAHAADPTTRGEPLEHTKRVLDARATPA